MTKKKKEKNKQRVWNYPKIFIEVFKKICSKKSEQNTDKGRKNSEEQNEIEALIRDNELKLNEISLKDSDDSLRYILCLLVHHFPDTECVKSAIELSAIKQLAHKQGKDFKEMNESDLEAFRKKKNDGKKSNHKHAISCYYGLVNFIKKKEPDENSLQKLKESLKRIFASSESHSKISLENFNQNNTTKTIPLPSSLANNLCLQYAQVINDLDKHQSPSNPQEHNINNLPGGQNHIQLQSGLSNNFQPPITNIPLIRLPVAPLLFQNQREIAELSNPFSFLATPKEKYAEPTTLQTAGEMTDDELKKLVFDNSESNNTGASSSCAAGVNNQNCGTSSELQSAAEEKATIDDNEGMPFEALFSDEDENEKNNSSASQGGIVLFNVGPKGDDKLFDDEEDNVFYDEKGDVEHPSANNSVENNKKNNNEELIQINEHIKRKQYEQVKKRIELYAKNPDDLVSIINSANIGFEQNEFIEFIILIYAYFTDKQEDAKQFFKNVAGRNIKAKMEDDLAIMIGKTSMFYLIGRNVINAELKNITDINDQQRNERYMQRLQQKGINYSNDYFWVAAREGINNIIQLCAAVNSDQSNEQKCLLDEGKRYCGNLIGDWKGFCEKNKDNVELQSINCFEALTKHKETLFKVMDSDSENEDKKQHHDKDTGDISKHDITACTNNANHISPNATTTTTAGNSTLSNSGDEGSPGTPTEFFYTLDELNKLKVNTTQQLNQSAGVTANMNPSRGSDETNHFTVENNNTKPPVITSPDAVKSNTGALSSCAAGANNQNCSTRSGSQRTADKVTTGNSDDGKLVSNTTTDQMRKPNLPLTSSKPRNANNIPIRLQRRRKINAILDEDQPTSVKVLKACIKKILSPDEKTDDQINQYIEMIKEMMERYDRQNLIKTKFFYNETVKERIILAWLKYYNEAKKTNITFTTEYELNNIYGVAITKEEYAELILGLDNIVENIGKNDELHRTLDEFFSKNNMLKGFQVVEGSDQKKHMISICERISTRSQQSRNKATTKTKGNHQANNNSSKRTSKSNIGNQKKVKKGSERHKKIYTAVVEKIKEEGEDCESVRQKINSNIAEQIQADDTLNCLFTKFKQSSEEHNRLMWLRYCAHHFGKTYLVNLIDESVKQVIKCEKGTKGRDSADFIYWLEKATNKRFEDYEKKYKKKIDKKTFAFTLKKVFDDFLSKNDNANHQANNAHALDGNNNKGALPQGVVPHANNPNNSQSNMTQKVPTDVTNINEPKHGAEEGRNNHSREDRCIDAKIGELTKNGGVIEVAGGDDEVVEIKNINNVKINNYSEGGNYTVGGDRCMNNLNSFFFAPVVDNKSATSTTSDRKRKQEKGLESSNKKPKIPPFTFFQQQQDTGQQLNNNSKGNSNNAEQQDENFFAASKQI